MTDPKEAAVAALAEGLRAVALESASLDEYTRRHKQAGAPAILDALPDGWVLMSTADLEARDELTEGEERERLLDEWRRLLDDSEWPFDAAALTVKVSSLFTDPGDGPVQPSPHVHTYTWADTETVNGATPPLGAPCIGCGHPYGPEATK